VIERRLQPRLLELATKFPVVTLTGPRQSGKTTLCRAAFPGKLYISLEAPDVREFAGADPRGFLATCRDGAILDEVHRVPDLLSYLQVDVDRDRTPGRFILTGSANFSLLRSLGQSLAGRTALLELLPLDLEETRHFGPLPADPFTLLWRGTYPAIYDRGFAPEDWYPAYAATYLERDVRSILNVADMSAFQAFLGLAAGRAGQLLNLHALGADAGVSHATARAWLTVLETGYVAWRLPPFHASVSSRLVKTPKLHFVDPGLACYLLGIRSADQLRTHPLRGAVFETWVASEIRKRFSHAGRTSPMTFFRSRDGAEVDIVVPTETSLVAIEAKSGLTVGSDYFRGIASLEAVAARLVPPQPVSAIVVYGGDQTQRRTRGTIVAWSGLDKMEWL
jgi:uncharacterized protein